MAHKTLISGTAYSVTGGRELIGGTGYGCKGGKTLIGGTAFKVKFDDGLTWIINKTFRVMPLSQEIDFISNGKQFKRFSIIGDRINGFSLKLPGDRTVGSEVATTFGQDMTKISNGSVAVLGDAFDNGSSTTPEVAFIGDFFEFCAVFIFTSAALNGSFNAILGHIACFGTIYGKFQTNVHGGVATTLTGSQSDFTCEACEDSTFLSIGSAFLALNCGPV